MKRVCDSIRHFEACGGSLPKSISNTHVPWYAGTQPAALRLLKPNLIQLWALLEIGRCTVSFGSASCCNINSVFPGLPTHVAPPVEKEERLHWL